MERKYGPPQNGMQAARIEVNEMRTLRWMCRMTRKDKIMNEHIIGTTKVAQTSKKIMELEKTGMVT